MQYHIFSPYRVCPLGAHVDHQHGLVTGFAIDKGVDLWFDVADDGHVHLESKTFEGIVDFDIDAPSQVRERHWGDYARGAKYALKKRFELKRGITGVIQGSLPVGGLSSSAAVLIAYVMAFAKANDITLQPFEVVKIASEAEREYIGLNNGLLDQACIALGKKNQLLFLDCDSNEYRLIPFGGQQQSTENSQLSIVNSQLPFEIGIFFSGLTRSLVNSDYNLRVYECKTAAWNMLAYTEQPLKTFDKTFLRDIPKATFDKTRIAMPARFARRAEHFYSEYRRVRQGVTAWETGNLKLFGKLSFDSCESSIHNYECGSPELIAIYEIMRSLPGVYGGRFSGAGFKGACIALVDPAHKAEIEKVLTERYLAQFPEYERTFQVFWVKPDDGARFLEN
ncbi:galactokinase family protein [Prevotella communis]|uniref:GHMP family kinase ATP-binding protein n=1 Tax=Prevotella communis TaxID=2913614 RepID=UPI001EDA43AF|nr:galactokinase family protein [Prevotella communis]UKK56939.1 galactokinase [Prevotella communis]UKK59647.1 galactokinase [Prevotella communis]UKK67626.1 galactokinase [Prevotella communis]UKK70227.1 galactokinase [Prevotella communis]